MPAPALCPHCAWSEQVHAFEPLEIARVARLLEEHLVQAHAQSRPAAQALAESWALTAMHAAKLDI